MDEVLAKYTTFVIEEEWLKFAPVEEWLKFAPADSEQFTRHGESYPRNTGPKREITSGPAASAPPTPSNSNGINKPGAETSLQPGMTNVRILRFAPGVQHYAGLCPVMKAAELTTLRSH
jgi:hypothetical protein